MRGDDNRRRCTRDGEFLDHQRVRNLVEAGATVFFGNEGAQHAEAAEFVDAFLGIPMGAIGLDPDALELFCGEAPCGIARRTLGGGKFQLH